MRTCYYFFTYTRPSSSKLLATPLCWAPSNILLVLHLSHRRRLIFVEPYLQRALFNGMWRAPNSVYRHKNLVAKATGWRAWAVTAPPLEKSSNCITVTRLGTRTRVHFSLVCRFFLISAHKLSLWAFLYGKWKRKPEKSSQNRAS